MNAISLICRLHQHRQWVNRQLLVAADGLSQGQLQQEFPIGQGTIWLSLTHLFAAEYIWLAALGGEEAPIAPGDAAGKLPGNQEAADAFTSLEQLRQAWSSLDERWERYLTSLQAAALDEIVYKTSSLGGQRAGTRRGDILLHVCTHAQYTTAQVVNMMRHCGVATLPDAMLISLARQEG